MYPLPLLSLFSSHRSCSFTRQLSENCPRNIFSNQMCQFVHNGHGHPSFLPSRPPSHHFPLFPLECACVVRRSLRRSIRRCPPPFSILRSPIALPSPSSASPPSQIPRDIIAFAAAQFNSREVGFDMMAAERERVRILASSRIACNIGITNSVVFINWGQET